MKSKIISMTELTDNKFGAYCEDKYLFIFDSKSFREKSKIHILPMIKKIKRVNNDIIVALGEKRMYLISSAQKELLNETINDEIFDVCTEFNKLLVVCKDYIKQFNVRINENGKFLNLIDQLKIDYNINFLFLLKFQENGKINNRDVNIVCVFDEDKIQILKMKNK